MSTGPIFRKVEAWRQVSAQHAIRYDCLQDLETGAYRVVTAAFVSPGDRPFEAARDVFAEAFMAADWREPAPEHWFASLADAVADHDASFFDL